MVARGEHLADSFCTSCHSLTTELPLSGGVDLGKDFAIPLGYFIGANLTPAGPLTSWSDEEIFRALRNGVDRDGHRLVIMSGVRARNMSDEDNLGSIQAPPKAATVAYGEYIFSYQDCRDCHGEDLRGGVEGQLAPIDPTLVGSKFWTTLEFCPYFFCIFSKNE